MLNRRLLPAALSGALVLVACTPQIPPLSNGDSTSPSPTQPASQPTAATAPPTSVPAKPVSSPEPSPTWIQAGLANTDLRAVTADPKQPSTVYTGGVGLFGSSDGGKSWLSIRPDFRTRDIAVSPADSSIIYAGASVGCALGTTMPAYRTVDGGKTWTAIGNNLASYAPHPTQADVVYAASCSGVVKSVDGGKTWQTLQGSRPENFDVLEVALAPSAPDTIYTMSASEGGSAKVSRSTDGGQSWQDITPNGDPWAPIELAVDPTDPNVVLAVTARSVYRTVDGGSSWTMANAGLDAIKKVDNGLVTYPLSSVAIDPSRPQVVYLGTGGLASSGSGVFRSWDGGENWHPIGDGLGTKPVRDLTFAGGLIFAATDDGVYRIQW